jgi:hypothetical protein
VSICLSTDLPLYYWAHRFSEAAKLADYQYLLTRPARPHRQRHGPGRREGFPWPKPENVRDLAFARLLPVRQSIGQFLSRYPAKAIGGLTSVELAHGSELAAEAKVLLGWVGPDRACGGPAGIGTLHRAPGARARGDRAHLQLSRREALIQVERGPRRRPQRLRRGLRHRPRRDPGRRRLLSPENALSEAMFF